MWWVFCDNHEKFVYDVGGVVTRAGLSRELGCDEDGIESSHYASGGCVVTRAGLLRGVWL